MQETLIRPVTDNTLRSQIVRQLRALVTGGTFVPGQRLTETSLADQLQVSRAPLREAIQQLIDSGILVRQAYRGLFVRPVSPEDLMELYSMRINLEKFAFQMGWEKRSRAARSDLQKRYHALRDIQIHGSQDRVIEHEIEFHSWIYEVSGHKLLLSYWDKLSSMLQIYYSIHHKTHGSHGRYVDMTTRYRELALGDNLNEMHDHIEEHMGMGLTEIIEILQTETN